MRCSWRTIAGGPPAERLSEFTAKSHGQKLLAAKSKSLIAIPRRWLVCGQRRVAELRADLVPQTRQHIIAPPIHLALIHLDGGYFPGHEGGREIEHPIGSDLAAAFEPKLVVG